MMTSKSLRFVLFCLLVLTASANASLAAVGKNGMVSSTHSLATEAAVDILESGGNAIDAAVAIQFILSVIQPQSTGLGGGSIILYYDANAEEVYALDGREEAPFGFHGRQFCKNNDCLQNENCDCTDGVLEGADIKTGGHPVGVPGTVHAALRLLDEYGTMPLSELMVPAIDFARNGFPMYEKLYNEIVNHKDRLTLFPQSAELFLSPNKTAPKCEIGESFFNPDIANTLEMLVEEGVDLFYTGTVAKAIVNATKSFPNPSTNKYGLLSLSDLEMYTSVYRKPTESTYRGKKSYGFGAAASGSLVVQQMLNLLEAYDLPSLQSLSVEALHRLADVQHAAFADRNKYLADPDWVDVPIDGLLNKTYARERREELFYAFGASKVPLPPGNPEGVYENWAIVTEDHECGTTHWNVVDKKGNVVSWTSTIEENLGAALVVPGFGFLLNNELTDFEHFESDENGVMYANAAAGDKRERRTALRGEHKTIGGKRPRSSMAPLLLFNNTGEFYLSIGSPGGSSIPGAVFNVLVNTMDFGMDLQVATDTSRIIAKNQFTSAETEIYETKESAVMEALLARGFHFETATPTTATYGRVQSILAGRNGYYYGAADVLREPQASAKGY